MSWMEKRKRHLNILNWGQMPTKEAALTEEMDSFPEDVSCNTLLPNERWLNGGKPWSCHCSKHGADCELQHLQSPEVRGRCRDTELSRVINTQRDRTKTESPKDEARQIDSTKLWTVGHGVSCIWKGGQLNIGKRCQRCLFILWLTLCVVPFRICSVFSAWLGEHFWAKHGKGKAEAKNSPQYQRESMTHSNLLLQYEVLIPAHVRHVKPACRQYKVEKTLTAERSTCQLRCRFCARLELFYPCQAIYLLPPNPSIFNKSSYVWTFTHKTAPIFVATPSTLVRGRLDADLWAFGAMAL